MKKKREEEEIEFEISSLLIDGRPATKSEVDGEVIDYGKASLENHEYNKLITDGVNLTGKYYKNMSNVEVKDESNLTNLLKVGERLNIQNIFNSTKLKFSWGENNIDYSLNKKDVIRNTYSIDINTDYGQVEIKCYKLIIDIPNFGIIEGKKPFLIIDRYKKKARKGFKKVDGEATELLKYRKSGFKHYKNLYDGTADNFVTEIAIDKRSMVLGDINFNADKLFQIGLFNSEYPWFTTKGSGKGIGNSGVNPGNIDLNKSGNVCSTKLRFRIGWMYDGNVFKTFDSGQIMILINRESNNYNKFVMTYKMI